MAWLDRLAPDYRRRAYVNLGIVVALLFGVANIGRLGKSGALIAIEWFIGLSVLYLCVWPVVVLVRARPKAPPPAFVLLASWIAAYAYVAAAIPLKRDLPGDSLALLIGLVLMIAFFVTYRRFVFPRFKERFTAVQEAQIAERAQGPR
jgi:hypothetical protein